VAVWLLAGAVSLAVLGGALQRWRRGGTPAPVATAAGQDAPARKPPTARAATRPSTVGTARSPRSDPGRTAPAATSTTPALVEEAPGAPPAPLPVSAQWYEGADGYRRAQEEQRRTRAAMLVYFRVDWCPYCQRLDREVLPAAAVSRFLAGVVKVRVNPERSAPDRALAQSYGADRFPSVFVIPRPEARPEKISALSRSGDEAIDVTADKFVQACTKVGLGQSLELISGAAAKLSGGDLAGARADLDRAIDLDPQSASAHRWRGYAEARAGDPGKAAGFFRRAIELDPRDPFPYWQLVALHGRAGQLDEAITLLTRLLDVAPPEDRGLAFAQRAYAHQQKGEAARAAADYDEACRLGQTRTCQAAAAARAPTPR
jgi:tetratricopeptide (TPR) repeat protein